MRCYILLLEEHITCWVKNREKFRIPSSRAGLRSASAFQDKYLGCDDKPFFFYFIIPDSRAGAGRGRGGREGEGFNRLIGQDSCILIFPRSEASVKKCQNQNTMALGVITYICSK